MFGWFKRQKGRAAEPFLFLRPGDRYRVVRSFVDHDGVDHPVGESWTFLRSNFLPYEDGVSLFVKGADGAERQLRLQWRAEAEGQILNHLEDYVLPAQGEGRHWTLLMTRDSVCMGDDVLAPHWSTLQVARDADAAMVARAVLSANYLAWVGAGATWSLSLGADRVLFGYRKGRRFVMPAGQEPLTARADMIDRLEIAYHAQVAPESLVSGEAGRSQPD